MTSEVFMSPAQSLSKSLAAGWQGTARASSGLSRDPPPGDGNGGAKATAGPGTTGAKPLEEAQKAAPAGDDEQGLEPERLSEAVEELNGLVQNVRRELRFSVDDNSGRSVISVIDSETEEVIRQIPPEQVMSLIEHFKESEGGLFQEKA
jgi:flagellar protein FlaG